MLMVPGLEKRTSGRCLRETVLRKEGRIGGDMGHRKGGGVSQGG